MWKEQIPNGSLRWFLLPNYVNRRCLLNERINSVTSTWSVLLEIRRGKKIVYMYDFIDKLKRYLMLRYRYLQKERRSLTVSLIGVWLLGITLRWWLRWKHWYKECFSVIAILSKTLFAMNNWTILSKVSLLQHGLLIECVIIHDLYTIWRIKLNFTMQFCGDDPALPR